MRACASALQDSDMNRPRRSYIGWFGVLPLILSHMPLPPQTIAAAVLLSCFGVLPLILSPRSKPPLYAAAAHRGLVPLPRCFHALGSPLDPVTAHAAAAHTFIPGPYLDTHQYPDVIRRYIWYIYRHQDVIRRDLMVRLYHRHVPGRDQGSRDQGSRDQDHVTRDRVTRDHVTRDHVPYQGSRPIPGRDPPLYMVYIPSPGRGLP